MNIAGVVVDALPQQNRLVEQQLLALRGVEVHAISEKGRMVVTVEGENRECVADVVTEMHNLKGVLSAAMVYHNFEQVCEAQGGLK